MSDEEFTRLRDEADERGITLSRYINGNRTRPSPPNLGDSLAPI